MSAAPPPGPAATAMFTQHTTCTSGRLSSPKKHQNRHPRAAIRAQTRGRKPNAKVRPPAVVATTSDPSAHSLSSLVTCPAANCRGKRETPGVRHKSTSSVSAAQVLVEFHRLFAGFLPQTSETTAPHGTECTLKIDRRRATAVDQLFLILAAGRAHEQNFTWRPQKASRIAEIRRWA